MVILSKEHLNLTFKTIILAFLIIFTSKRKFIKQQI